MMLLLLLLRNWVKLRVRREMGGDLGAAGASWGAYRGGGSRGLATKEEAVDHESRPSAHITYHNEHNRQQVDHLILVPEAHSMGFASLELG